MSEQTSSRTNEQIAKIDLTQWIDRFLHSFRRLWWLVVLLAAAGGAWQYFHVQRTYVPHYQAEATLTISATSEGQSLGSDYYTNTATAEELSDVFSSIVQSGILNDIIADDLGLDYVPGSYNVQVIEGTNMLSVTATASDGQTAYDILMAVINDYPQVAQMVVGQTYPVLLEEPTVPEDTGKEYTSRGSAKRGVLFGLILSMVILALDMVLQRKVRYESDFTSLLHVSCLGVLPEIKTKKRKKSKAKEINILDASISSGYLEAMRSLRSRVERHLDKIGQKTFMVTSSIPSEGKSTVSTNLAAAFARKGKRVVLIDCDLRHPSVKKNLSLEGEFPGLEKVLTGKATFRDAIVKMEGMEMYVLPGTDTPSENIELLAGSAMKELILQAESFADVVILDTSPSAMLADAITLANNVPVALYVVRADYAKVRNILDGIEELAETGIDIMGCALNYAHGSGSHSGSAYGYGKYGYGKYGYGKYGYGKYGYGEERRHSRSHRNEESSQETSHHTSYAPLSASRPASAPVTPAAMPAAPAATMPAAPVTPAAAPVMTMPAAPAATIPAAPVAPAAPAVTTPVTPAAPAAIPAESIAALPEVKDTKEVKEAAAKTTPAAAEVPAEKLSPMEKIKRYTAEREAKRAAEDAARKAAEEAAQRAAEEEARKAAEEAARLKAEEEAKQAAEEAALREAERMAEEAARLKAEEEAQRAAEEAAKRAEEEARRAAEEAAKKAEEEARRAAEEAAQRAAEEAAKKAAEEAAQRAAEEEAARLAAERAEKLTQVNTSIADLEHRILLITRLQQVMQYGKAYQQLSGEDRRSYYMEHREELDTYSRTAKELKQLFGSSRIPSVRTLMAEREALLKQRTEFQETAK